jgi:hypothetical protein
MKVKLKPGDTVRVVGARGTATIRAILTDVHGNIRQILMAVILLAGIFSLL